MKKADTDILREWLRDKPTLPRKTINHIKALIHNKLPRHVRGWAALHWLCRTAVASSAPVLAWVYGGISWGLAIIATTVVFLAHTLVSTMDYLKSPKSNDKLATSLTIRFGEILSALPPPPKTGRDKTDSITAALGIIEAIACQVTRSPKGDVAVSLARYVGSSENEMEIRWRNPGNERPRKKFPVEKVLGHHACKSPEAPPRVVHDLKEMGIFGRFSPTQSSVDYRSILIMPIARSDAAELPAAKIVGFVSIDSKRPYAFYGNRADEIIVACETLTNHIRQMV